MRWQCISHPRRQSCCTITCVVNQQRHTSREMILGTDTFSHVGSFIRSKVLSLLEHCQRCVDFQSLRQSSCTFQTNVIVKQAVIDSSHESNDSKSRNGDAHNFPSGLTSALSTTCCAVERWRRLARPHHQYRCPPTYVDMDWVTMLQIMSID